MHTHNLKVTSSILVGSISFAFYAFQTQPNAPRNERDARHKTPSQSHTYTIHRHDALRYRHYVTPHQHHHSLRPSERQDKYSIRSPDSYNSCKRPVRHGYWVAHQYLSSPTLQQDDVTGPGFFVRSTSILIIVATIQALIL